MMPASIRCQFSTLWRKSKNGVGTTLSLTRLETNWKHSRHVARCCGQKRLLVQRYINAWPTSVCLSFSVLPRKHALCSPRVNFPFGHRKLASSCSHVVDSGKPVWRVGPGRFLHFGITVPKADVLSGWKRRQQRFAPDCSHMCWDKRTLQCFRAKKVHVAVLTFTLRSFLFSWQHPRTQDVFRARHDSHHERTTIPENTHFEWYEIVSQHVKRHWYGKYLHCAYLCIRIKNGRCACHSGWLSLRWSWTRRRFWSQGQILQCRHTMVFLNMSILNLCMRIRWFFYILACVTLQSSDNHKVFEANTVMNLLMKLRTFQSLIPTIQPNSYLSAYKEGDMNSVLWSSSSSDVWQSQP